MTFKAQKLKERSTQGRTRGKSHLRCQYKGQRFISKSVCFFLFFPGSPCLLHLAKLHVIMAALCTLTGFQQCGHARIVSIPGFFHKLPWLSTASWNGHIFTDWPATINLLCRGSDGTLNLYSQHPIPALTDDMNKLLFSHRALTVTGPWVWILQAWLPPLNGYVSHVRGLLEPNLSHARRHLRRWEAQHDL